MIFVPLPHPRKSHVFYRITGKYAIFYEKHLKINAQWIKTKRIVTAKIVIVVFFYVRDYTIFESNIKLDDIIVVGSVFSVSLFS